MAHVRMNSHCATTADSPAQEDVMPECKGSLWTSADAYERYMGRWSRQIAPLFLQWLAIPAGMDWIDIGCGTGVLSSVIAERCAPRRLAGVDPSEAFLSTARSRVIDPSAEFRPGSADHLPYTDREFNAAVSGLVLNFVADKDKALAEMARVVAPGGSVALYVWDYAGHMQIMRQFFDAAIELDEGARRFDDGVMAPVCRPGPLAQLFEAARLDDIEVRALDIPAAFASFDDYWAPFLGGTGSGPKYCASLSCDARARLRERLSVRVPTGPDGEILLAVRAWAVKGKVRR
jgi:SAM-dependent methyltransferase